MRAPLLSRSHRRRAEIKLPVEVFFDGDGVCAYKGKKLDTLSKEELIKIIKEMGLAYLRIHATTA